ncbi:MAG: hemolysin III family protein [Spirochaetaceae bacterium]|jgi:hemolysin III|nr:hemolysin III family protein [Spirochaetaceae bacterium]
MNKQITVPVRRSQTTGEEIANSILHGMGVLFAITGFILLVMRTRGFLGGSSGGRKALVACSIYAATLIVLFLASTLYHAITNQKAKRILRVLDHSAIYLLIAGTYTPICIIMLPEVSGLILVVVEWALAITGIILNGLNLKFVKKLEVIIYLAMGWAIAAGGPALIRNIPKLTLVFLVAGGVLYSLGVLFYKKHERRFFHVIWHVFVLAAAVLQWVAIYLIS